MVERWLSPEILAWQALSFVGDPPNEDLVSRSYAMLEHAEKLLQHPSSDLSLVDVVTTLRRAVDRRVRALHAVYSFRTIPVRDKPNDPLLLLEFFGIVRSRMFQKLVDIRNAVEHEDATPPDLETCKDFAEFTWYFLRSTDRILQNVTDGFELQPFGHDERYYSLRVTYGPENSWKPSVWGWIRPGMMIERPEAEWIYLNLEKSETRKELTKRLRGTPGAVKRNEDGRGRNSNDVCISGEVRGPASAILRISKTYFALI